MDLFVEGLITKGVKTGIISFFLVILIIKQIKTEKYSRIKSDNIHWLLLLWGLSLNIFDILTSTATGTLILPTTDPYFGWFLIRFTFMGILLLLLGIIIIRMILYKNNQTITGRMSRDNSHHMERVRYNALLIRPKQEHPKIPIPQSADKRKVNYLVVLISVLLYAAFLVIRIMAMVFQRNYDWIWEIYEIIDVLFWIFLGISMITFHRKQQPKLVV